jgi:SagB-type dehydrogenase family enzyme
MSGAVDAMTSVISERRLSLRPGVILATSDGDVRLLRPQLLWLAEKSLGTPDPVKRALLTRLAEGGCTRRELLAMGDAGNGIGEDVASFVDALDSGGWLMSTVRFQGRDLYTMQPRTAPADPPSEPVDDPVLSRFAVLRREGDQILVESPLAQAQVLVHDAEVSALIGGLAGTVAEGSFPAEVRDLIIKDLYEAGLVVSRSREETEPGVGLWRPHDLWFHARSRMGNGGYFGAGFGRTHWGKTVSEPLPAKREPHLGPEVDLYRPDLAELRDHDRPLTAVLEDRRSIRAHDDESPITADQLGELLFRCARNRRSDFVDGMEYLSAPYPAGGGAYELELYPIVRRVSGLDQGMYHYDAHEHRIRLIREPGPQTGQLLHAALRGAVMSAPPQVLIVLAARFGRVMWSYEELAYSLILKHVGALFQTMYLVATSMGLAACALGGGNSLAFTEATGLDYAVESSVGEFVLGSRPAHEPTP